MSINYGKLEEYANSENTELGEYWLLLCDIYRYKYLANDEFILSLEKEIEDQLQLAEQTFT